MRRPLFCLLFLLAFVFSPDSQSRASEQDSAASSPQPPAIAGGNLSTLLANDGSYLVRSLYRDGVRSNYGAEISGSIFHR